MESWEREIKNRNNDFKDFVEKSENPNVLELHELKEFLKSNNMVIETFNDITKGPKDVSKLIKKEVWVSRNGKRYKQTVYVKSGDDKEKPQSTPVGEELSPTVSGMNITKYSEKAILITGDTKSNVDTLREIKTSTGVGNWNRKLNGWVFPLTYLDDILGTIWSKFKNSGEDEKAQAIQNQKNASLNPGDKATVKGEDITITKNSSDTNGIKYDAKDEDGNDLKGIDEKVLDVPAEKNDKKISEIINNTSESNRSKTEKQIYGIKPIKDIQNYSLSEYMGMHGLSQEDIDSALERLKSRKESGKKRSGGSSTSSKPKTEQQKELTKRQLIGKLVYAHYQAVKKAINEEKDLDLKVLETYPDLKAEYSKKREAMSEETKRKISEALKKNKAKEEAKKLIDGISKEDLNKLKDVYSEAMNEFTSKEQEKLSELIAKKEKIQKEYYSLYEKAKNTEDYSEKNKLKDQAREKNVLVKKLTKNIRSQSNKVQALNNGGSLISVTDQTGMKHEGIADFRGIDSQNISYDIDTILTENKPKYIPDIDEEEFKGKGFILDSIRVNKDSYMVSVNGHKEKGDSLGYSSKTGNNEYTGFNSENSGYVALTLDQLVLTNDYYTTKQKALYKKTAEEKTQRGLDQWNKKSDDEKKKYMAYYASYGNIGSKLKKKFSKESWESMTWQEKEEHFKPVKKYNPERLKSTISSDNMWGSFHDMHQRFVDINAKPYKMVNGVKHEFNLGEERRGTYGHKKAFESWNSFREMLEWKINDINIQREEISGIRQKALETSYGDSGTNNSLVDSLGVKVKRQNGDEIKPKEIEQLEGAWKNVQQSFGSLKENAKKDNLKLSHAGKTYMYASKAIGVYVPSYKTIGVTAKYGEDSLGFTMGHEVAHWIDNTIGKSKGKRFASDDFESTAGQIAITFRKNMNSKSESKYTNSTHEAMARAMEQYHAIESNGYDAMIAGAEKYVASKDYVPKNVYDSQIKPLIKQFLDENKELLKSVDSFGLFRK